MNILNPISLMVIFMCLTSQPTLAACNATVNGHPMTPQQCVYSVQVYGHVIPGHYAMDGYGNWVNLNNPRHRGNLYKDTQKIFKKAGGVFGGGSLISPRGLYDPSGGCEGGSCVNIID